MANAKLHKTLSLNNHYRLLELSIYGSKSILELLRRMPLVNYPTPKLENCLFVLETHLNEAIQSAIECKKAFREYSQSLNSDTGQA